MPLRKKKRVVVAMSGGVDSSVTAAILQAQGCEVIGVHLNFWNDPSVAPDKPGATDFAKLPQNKCCTLGGLEDARAVCAWLKIPFYVMNVVEQFKSEVVDYFLETSAAGETPNPCVECNRTIKFGELLRRAAELNADALASGHYAQVLKNVATGRFELHMPEDKEKDQTYFLYHLGQEKLSKILFPLGGMKKSEVYELARRFDLPRVIEKPQSQGLCFFSEATPKYFLQRYLAPGLFRAGPIMTVDGRVLGEHKGLPMYTVGQRQGIGIGGVKGELEGEPWYVVRTEPSTNTLVVGRERDIYKNEFWCEGLSFIAGGSSQSFEAEVRIRHRGSLTPVTITISEERAHVTARSGIRAISPGQAAVFYKKGKVLGGGTIISFPAYDEAKQIHEERAGLSVAH